MKLSHVFKWHWGTKDGGPESKVWCYGFESKLLFSVLVLRFDKGSREAFHTHAFNALSWVLSGWLWETSAPIGQYGRWDAHTGRFHNPGVKPVFTSRETYHKVDGVAERSWVLTFRGPWIDKWREYLPASKRNIVLTHGRKEVTT